MDSKENWCEPTKETTRSMTAGINQITHKIRLIFMSTKLQEH